MTVRQVEWPTDKVDGPQNPTEPPGSADFGLGTGFAVRATGSTRSAGATDYRLYYMAAEADANAQRQRKSNGKAVNGKGQGESRSRGVNGSGHANGVGGQRRSSGRGRRGDGGGRVHDPRGGDRAERQIEARRRKEKIRRRKRKHNRVTVIQNLTDRLERQPETESESLVGVTCRTASYFVILFSVVLFLRSAIAQYTAGMIYQLNHGYLFATSQTDLIKGTEKIGFVVTMICVALFGRRSHRPLLVACGTLVLAVGAMIWPVPYFVTSTQGGLNVSYGCVQPRIPPTQDVLDTSVPSSIYGQLCKKSRNSSSPFLDSCTACPSNFDWIGHTEAFVYIVGFAGFLIGFGTGLFLTSGIVYIEESSRKTDTPLQYGFLFFMSGLGEFLGSCFAWWFVNYPEDLKGGPVAPWSVRAWWLGMVIFSCLLLAISWIFIIFPKWIIEPSWSAARRQARLGRLAKLLAAAKRDRQKRREQMKREKQKQKRNRQTPGIDANPTRLSVNDDASPASVSNGLDAVRTEAPDRSDTDSDDDDAGVGRANSSAVQSPTASETLPRVSVPAKGVTFGAVSEPVDVSDTPPAARTPNPPHAALTDPPKSRGPQTQDMVSKTLSECFQAIWRLVSEPTYLLAIVSVTLAAYLPAGYRTSVARFVRAQYKYDEMSSFFYADGLCYSLADAIGSIAGGFIVWKLRLNLIRRLRLIIVALSINVVFFFLLFSVGCWKNGAPLAVTNGTTPSSVGPTSDFTQCSTDCDCSGAQLEPVCSLGGARFLSPCDAGCFAASVRDSNLVYSSCLCSSSRDPPSSGGSTSASEVSAAYCSTCSVFGAYWVLLLIAVSAHSTAYVSILLLFLRIVKEEQRVISLSFAVWIVALGAYVPGAAVFQGIGDSSCKHWDDDCFSESVCWLHDLDKFRYVIHGSNIVFQAVSIVGFVLILFVLDALNPCSKSNRGPAVLEEPDDGHLEHLRRGKNISVLAPMDVMLLRGGVEGSSPRSSDSRGSYVSPVFEMGEVDPGSGSYSDSPQNSVLHDPRSTDDLDVASTRGRVLHMDNISISGDSVL